MTIWISEGALDNALYETLILKDLKQNLKYVVLKRDKRKIMKIQIKKMNTESVSDGER